MNFSKKKINLINIFILNLFILIILIFLMNLKPSSKYEFNITNNIEYIWLFLILLNVIIILLISIFKNIKYIYFNIFINIIFIAIPKIKGYYLYGTGDILTHMGFIKDIIFNNYFSSFYPADHLLVINIMYVTKVSLINIVMIIPIIFYIIIIIFWYNIIKNKNVYNKNILLFLPFFLIYQQLQISYAPFNQSFFIFSIIIYLLYFCNINEYRIFIVLMIISISLVFWHPIVSFIIMIVLIILHFYNSYFEKANKNNKYIYLFLIICVIYLAWSSYIYIATKNFQIAIIGLISNSSDSEISEKASYVTNYNVSIKDSILYVIFSYSQYVIIIIVALFYIIYQLNRQRLKKSFNIKQNKNIIIFLTFCLMTFFTLVAGRIIEFLRILIFAILTFPIILFNIKQKRILYKYLNVIILITIIIISSYSLYDSPLKRKVNRQISEKDYISMKSFFVIRNESLIIEELGISQDRYYDYIYGRATNRENIYYGEMVVPMDHFGYDKNISYKTKNSKNIYLLINYIGKYYYESMYPNYLEYAKYNYKDFKNLNIDHNVNKIYNNDEFNIYYIRENEVY